MRIALTTIIVIILILFSCETEVDIITPVTKTMPVVYAVIDPYDSIKSVRVERSFIIRDWAGAQLNDEDSLYFSDVEEFLGAKTDGVIQWEYILEKVDVTKIEGQFTGKNHHVYQLAEVLPIEISKTYYGYGAPNVASLYLKIIVNDIKDTLFSESPVFSPGWIEKFPKGKTIGLYQQNTTSFMVKAATISPTRTINYKEIKFKVYVSEFSANGRKEVIIEWRTTSGFGDRGYYLTPERLFNRIMMGLDLTDNVSSRVLNFIDIEMTMAKRNYGEYQANLSPFEGMIDYPIQGIENAYGFFHTKTSASLPGLRLDRKSLDSLCNSPKWSHLKFKIW